MGAAIQRNLEVDTATLVLAAKQHDQDAALALIERCERRIVAAIQIAGVSRIDDDFEDAQNLALLEIWKQLPKLESDAAVCSWMERIARGVTASRVVGPLVRQRRRDERYRNHQPADAATQPGPGDSISERDLLARALVQLSVEHREVLVLRYLEGYSERETADLLQIPVKSVSSRAARAKRAAMDAVATLEETT